MKTYRLHETYFRIEKLLNVVGIGRSSAYQVITTPGRVIGVIGPVADPGNIRSQNEPCFVEHADSGTSKAGFACWLRNSLATLGF